MVSRYSWTAIGIPATSWLHISVSRTPLIAHAFDPVCAASKLTDFSSIFLFLGIFWKIVKRTKVHALEDVDLLTGKSDIDAIEDMWVERTPKNMLEKVCRRLDEVPPT